MTSTRPTARRFTLRSSAGPFVIAWRNVTPFYGRNTHFASIGLLIADKRFGVWTNQQSLADFVGPFCAGLQASLTYCDGIPAPCRGELLACPPLDLANVMENAPRDRPPLRRRFPACHAEQAAGRFQLCSTEVGCHAYDFPATDRVYLVSDTAVCRIVAARCTWRLDRCIIRKNTLAEAWVARSAFDRMLRQMADFDVTAAGARPPAPPVQARRRRPASARRT
ncbi:MAG TPA: hypothetical protein VEB22_06460 [Phycisphaerales bacterium]|nr:hypothetical protein [Phycisphaerales bacterium]